MSNPEPSSEVRAERVSRVRIDRVLPPKLIDEIRDAVSGHRRSTKALTNGIDRRFSISAAYGVSTGQLQRFLRRLIKPRPAAETNRTQRATDDEPQWERKLSAHRRRQASVGAILERTFGRFAESNPELWERRAYLLLVGMTYARLATGEDDVSTDELVKLAKALAENRKVEARSREREELRRERGSDDPARPLPEHFGALVRRVYGTNFHSPAEASKKGGAGE